MAITAATRPAPQTTDRKSITHDHLFYGGMAIALGLTVFAGFASSYYLRFLDGGPKATLTGGPITALVHGHAALFTAWVLLFIVQTALVASRRVAVHRRLGVAGALLAAAMLAAGTFLAIATAARGSAPAGADPLAFLAIPIFDMVLFATFVTAALALRRDKEAHKRLMLLAYVSIVVAAVGRLPGVLPLRPPAFFGLQLAFVVVGGIYDFLSRRRVHKVYVWGGALIMVSVPRAVDHLGHGRLAGLCGAIDKVGPRDGQESPGGHGISPTPKLEAWGRSTWKSGAPADRMMAMLAHRLSERPRCIMFKWLRSVALLAVLGPVTAEAVDLEWRPALAGGYSKIVDAHGSIGAALRLQVARFFFVQPEYLVLPGEGHTDHGPTIQAGLSSGSRDALRPFVGLGGGPVNGYQGDDGLFYVALGVSHPLGRSQGVFVQGEVRFGLLGESAYSQFAVAIGLSR